VVVPDGDGLDVAGHEQLGELARVDVGGANGLVKLTHDGAVGRDPGLVLRQRDVLEGERGRRGAAARGGRRPDGRGRVGEPRELVDVRPAVAAHVGQRRVGVGVDHVQRQARGVVARRAEHREHEVGVPKDGRAVDLRVGLVQAAGHRKELGRDLRVVEARLAVVVALDGHPGHGRVGAARRPVGEQALDGRRAAEEVTAAHVVAREDKEVGVLLLDERAPKGRRVLVAARVALLRRGEVLAEGILRKVGVGWGAEEEASERARARAHTHACSARAPRADATHKPRRS